MENRLTIKDIARLSGVGKSTVSRVINNEDGVSARTRDKVLQIIQQHNFSPSKWARSMRGCSDKVVAIIVSRLDSPAENLAVRAMLPLLYQQGYDPIVLESQFSSQRVEEHLQVLQQRNIDGLVLFGFTGLEEAILAPWRERMVMMARALPGISSVGYDNAGAVRLLAAQFMQRNLRHISFIGVQPQDTTTGQLRTAAYLEVCQQQALKPVMALGDLSYQSGFDLLPEVLTPDTEAVICASDSIALGAQKYLQQQSGRSILVGCVGDNPLLQFLFPSTLFACLGYGDSGEAAARQLMAQLAGNPIQQLIIPAQMTN